jgi:hypothetical protein
MFTSVSLQVLHDPMIRKQLPGFIITPGVGHLGILGGILHGRCQLVAYRQDQRA